MRTAGQSWKPTLLTALAIVAAPILGLNALLAFNAFATARAEIEGVADSALHIAETRLDDAATQVMLLGMKSVSTCAGDDLKALQTASNAARIIAEVALIDVNGAASCAAFGDPRVVRLASPEHGTLTPDIVLSVVEIGGVQNDRMVRLEWGGDGRQGVRVLIAASDLLPDFLRGRMTSGFVATAELTDGAVISRKLTDPSLAEPAPSLLPAVLATAVSQRYPLRIDVTAPGSALYDANVRLFIYANVGGFAFALVVGLVAFLIGRRSGGPLREIADGIRKGEFVPYYQPVIDIASGKLVGCEAMVRWLKPDGRVLPPGRFISIAEVSGEIFPMTLAVMERAKADLGDIYADRPQLKVGFNLCAGHFEDLQIVADVERVFGSSSIRMSQLMFEVTERQPLPDVPRARLVIAKLQSLGARVALDDVGTGHGGLSYLLKLGVDVMKMDKMFVDAIGTDRYSVAIVDSLVKLAEDMNLDLIAEGVETFGQVEYLRGKGVRMAQGYVFAPPLPASGYRTLVEAMLPLGKARSRTDSLARLRKTG